jgi:hypothetical protein
MIKIKLIYIMFGTASEPIRCDNSSYLPAVFQADQNSPTRIIMSISHPGMTKNISEQAFGKNTEIVSAAGAGI